MGAKCLTQVLSLLLNHKSRAIGDTFLKPLVIPDAEMTIYDLSDGDFIIIASDGLWDVVTPEVAVETVSNLQQRTPLSPNSSPETAAMELVQKAQRKESLDNITVIVCFLGNRIHNE